MTSGEGLRPAEILYVEDNAADVRLTVEALKDAKVRTNLHMAKDGEEALAFLHREGKYATAPRPDLVLLDLNLPKVSGREVLGIIKKDPNLKQIPVVILTTSRSEEDVARSYEAHANCFITKPVDLHKFLSVIRTIEGFWVTVVTLPQGKGRMDDLPNGPPHLGR
jgi:two-component system, chemotaxis family, response regulator Rcp1